MFTPLDRITLVRLLSVSTIDRVGFLLVLDAIEVDPTQASTVVEVQRLLGLIAQQETQIQKLTTKQAGLTKADVLEFDSCGAPRHVRAGIQANLRSIANLIGWSYPSASAGSY